MNEEDARRRRLLELGRFLRRRRASLRPKDVNLPAHGRRHIAGLRREEVAQLAGIGLSWYTLLEQGRVNRVGAKTLKKVADALVLTPLEREYVFTLAREEFEVPFAERSSPGSIVAFVRSTTANATFLTTSLSDVVAWNAFADELFNFSKIAQSERNMLAMMVRDPRLRFVFPDWSESLRNMIGVYRSNHAYAGASPGDVLAGELCAEDGDFARFWKEHSVRAPLGHVCAIRNERLGLLRFDFLAFVPVGHPTHALIVLRPLAET